MKAVLALVLLALLVVCAQSKRLYIPGKNYNGLPTRPRWFNKKPIAIAADEDDEEADFWMALAPLAINLVKNKLMKKRDDFDEEADFINLKKVWGVAKNIGKSYLSSKYGINLDEEEEADSEFLSKLKNWWNTKGKDLAIKGLQIYSSIKNGGAQQGDEEEEEEADQNRSFDFGANVNGRNWNVNAGLTGQTRNGGSYNVGGNFGNGGQWGVNGGYDRTWNNGRTSFGGNAGYGSGGFNAGVKFTHRFDDIEEEEADFINWKKVWGVAKDIGKNYLSTKYGINLDEEEESDSEFIKINWKKIGNIAKDIGKTYLSSKYGINLDEAEDEEESDSFAPPAFPSIGAPATYDYADHDSKGPSAGATAMKAWLQKYFPQGSFGGIYNYRPVRGGSNLSLHAEGRAIDWMLNANNAGQKAVGDALFAYLQKNGKNMGVQEAIWNRQIWTSRGVRAYTGQNPHTDHVHIGLNRWAAKNFRGN